MLRLIIYLFFLIFVYSVSAQEAFKVKSKLANDTQRQKLSPILFQDIQTKKLNKHVAYDLFVSVKDVKKMIADYADELIFKVDSSHSVTGIIQIKARETWIIKALQDPNIGYIMQKRKPFTERELTGFDLSVNKINLAHKQWPTINANQATISIKEDLFDTLDIDFKGRYLPSLSASSNMQTHATTMATIAAGGGNTFYTGKGVAWGANITSADFNNLLPDDLKGLQKLKVAVQNHSYGVGIENFYGVDAQAYDAQMNLDTTILHVFSAGNMGHLTSSAGPYTSVNGFANLTGSFKMAKNILTVGATDLYNNVISISSRGPAFDGRVKPDLVALGEDGTSGASAIVSGISLLIRDAFIKMHQTIQMPSSALIKAVLINSADDVGMPNVDFVSGYGAVNASKALKIVSDGNFFQGSVRSSEVNTHLIRLPSNVNKFKVSISWIDPAGNVNAANALVNDLDLTVVKLATSETYFPWVLNSTPSLTALQASAVRGRDSINNTEQISLEQPAAGIYQLVVRGAKMSSLLQPYSIAWSYDTLHQFQFSYPVIKDQILPLEKNIIRWETNITGLGDLQFKVEGSNWESISNQVDLQQQYYEWNAPNQLGQIQFRMMTSISNFLSDTVLCAPIISPKLGFNCVDSFLLYWPKLPISQYQLYQLGDKYLEEHQVVSDTFLIREKLNNPAKVYSVSPMINNQKGLAGYAMNYTQQQTDCYINGFFADPIGANNASLTLQLGTTYQIAQIVFEKLFATGFKGIRTISVINNRQLNIIEVAKSGLNTYRAKIELTNGRSYYSNTAQVLIFDNKPYYLFPNPVKLGNPITLMSESIDSTVVYIYDLNGKMVYTHIVSSFIEQIILPQLNKGIFYAIIRKSGIVQKRIPFIIL